MIHRRLVGPALAAALILAACGGDPPPPPQPVGPTAEELEQMRQDSIRAAEEAARLAREAAEAAERERAAAEAAMREARATLEEMVFFDYDESTLRADAEAVLRSKAGILRASPAVRIRIEGHADERGSTEYNIALGNARAEAVRQFFVSFGIDAGRFDMVSYGEERPLAMGSNESSWARNRRAEFVLTAGADQINPGM
ncbi:MAG: peptidoglycan-associated lipoprotein Pal [Gemmatimonadetes bacterium]|nr:peptidoglycan-associated lipoprotein Pal [Gemmatimonadota bacterium]NNF38118.1 peptidoglycan-associated lipoprotein Pal [Gemmatimonadota bacterium]